MGKQYHRKSKEVKNIAKERILILFDQAKLEFKNDKKLSDRYVHLARTIAMKYKLRMPKEVKRSYCKHCYSYLMPGKNLRVRTNNGKVIYHCKECKGFMRYPLKK